MDSPTNTKESEPENLHRQTVSEGPLKTAALPSFQGIRAPSSPIPGSFTWKRTLDCPPSPVHRHRPMPDDRHSSQPDVRIFDDEAQRIWSAGRERSVCGSDVLVFSCISDSRQPARAVATDDALSLS